MEIKIHKEEDGGYSVYRKEGKRWKYWLPESDIDCRGDEFYNFFRSAKAAENAARRAKEKLEEKDIILDI